MRFCGFAIPQAPLSGGAGGGFLCFAVLRFCSFAVNCSSFVSSSLRLFVSSSLRLFVSSSLRLFVSSSFLHALFYLLYLQQFVIVPAVFQYPCIFQSKSCLIILPGFLCPSKCIIDRSVYLIQDSHIVTSPAGNLCL